MTNFTRARYWLGGKLLRVSHWVYPTWENVGDERVWRITGITDGISDEDATSELLEAFQSGAAVGTGNVHTIYISTFGLRNLTIIEDSELINYHI